MHLWWRWNYGGIVYPPIWNTIKTGQNIWNLGFKTLGIISTKWKNGKQMKGVLGLIQITAWRVSRLWSLWVEKTDLGVREIGMARVPRNCLRALREKKKPRHRIFHLCKNSSFYQNNDQCACMWGGNHLNYLGKEWKYLQREMNKSKIIIRDSDTDFS